MDALSRSCNDTMHCASKILDSSRVIGLTFYLLSICACKSAPQVDTAATSRPQPAAPPTVVQTTQVPQSVPNPQESKPIVALPTAATPLASPDLPEQRAISVFDNAPSEAEIEALLQAAQEGNPEDLLAVIDQQNEKARPWEQSESGPRRSAQGPRGEIDYDETVQSALYHAYAIEPDSKAVGRPNRGHLQNGEPLPSNPTLYTIRRQGAAYASSHTALQVVTAFRNFRASTGYTGEVIIADVSPKGGGRYRTHHSHQTGRDLDILMPLMPGTRQWGKNIDWDTTWSLVRAFLETKEVEYIFLDYNIQKHLHAAAVRAGERPDSLKNLISWPVGVWNKTIIRNSPGHWAHVHVRIKCGPTETRCRSYH